MIKTITETLSAEAKPEEMFSQSFWVSKKALFDRLSGISPWLNSDWEARSGFRGFAMSAQEVDAYKRKAQEKFRMVYASGLLWFGSLDAKKGLGNITTESTYSHETVLKIYDAIVASGYITDDKFLNQLKLEIQEMGFGAKWWRPVPLLNWARNKRHGA